MRNLSGMRLARRGVEDLPPGSAVRPLSDEFRGPMNYAVKEIYYSLQGEGARTGRPAVFLRFAGCNLWSGREEDRTSAVCQFCDTAFGGRDGRGGGRCQPAEAVSRAVAANWPDKSRAYVVVTGGD